MDLKQLKLTRAEWDSIEVPVSPEEKEILQLIMEGYYQPTMKINRTTSMFSFLKIEQNADLDIFLYQKYFEPIIKKTTEKYGKTADFDFAKIIVANNNQLRKIKSIDSARIQNLETNIDKNRDSIYEFVLLEHAHNLYRNIAKKTSKYAFYLYTLLQLRKASIPQINGYVQKYVDELVEHVNSRTDLSQIIERAYDFIERNPYLLTYADKELFSHQRELFQIFNLNQTSMAIPKLVLYIAPTGTGKTLSPIGLVNEYRIIFVCMARHIGLALAKTAISMHRKIAFAFGCETASDIRLHNFAASTYTKHKKSGGIGKIDNADGTLVEIMICDVKSYLVAMNYMLAFNSATNVILYWDEPTITLDYPTHELHEIIHRNWTENKIPNVVFSCATLPTENELMPVLMDFRKKFGGEGEQVELRTITSYDCRKSIPIMTKDGHCAMPHTMYETHESLRVCVENCEENKTMLRYFDLNEIVKFAFYVNKSGFVPEGLKLQEYFQHIRDITMDSLKLYYLELLKRIPAAHWPVIYEYSRSILTGKFMRPSSSNMKKVASLDSNLTGKKEKQLCRISSVQEIPVFKVEKEKEREREREKEKEKEKLIVSSGILSTTEDAYTLTDGPTIFLCEDVTKIGNFYIQQSKIPTEVFQLILKKITKNNELAESIGKLETTIEDLETKFMKNSNSDDDKDNDKKLEKKTERNPELMRLYEEIDRLRKQVKYLAMDPEYIPNTKPHQKKWAPLSVIEKKDAEYFENAFVPNIDETTVREVMSLAVDNHLKVLLLLGIGMFMEGVHPTYLEIMKTLAMQQDLFMIIASSDYVYGTNYNFCHGYIGKDLKNMTKQKTLQCMGRIGRGNMQQTYTVRFREDEMIYELFRTPATNMEADNMCRLFSSD